MAATKNRTHSDAAGSNHKPLKVVQDTAPYHSRFSGQRKTRAPMKAAGLE
jgi:hypothetical protein